MYITKKDINPGCVLWAKRSIYYDQPNKPVENKANMFFVIKAMDDNFLGCPLERNNCNKNYNILKSKFYPIKYDSKVVTNIYKIPYGDIQSPILFQVTEGTLQNIKRNLYKRIILGYSEGPKEYSDIFTKEFLSENVPCVDNIIVYPSSDKKYKYYYIYDDNEEYYSLIELKRHDIDYFSVIDNNEVLMPKDIPYFDFYSDHSFDRSEVDKALFGIKEKKLGSIITSRHK